MPLGCFGVRRQAEGKSAARILLQESPVAGFQFYEGEAVWPRLKPNDRLLLVPEPGNRYDKRAVKVLWKQHRPGYVPRRENAAIHNMLARGEKLWAEIDRLQQAEDPWQRVRMRIFLVLNGKVLT